MRNQSVLITIAIPTYNRPKFLRQAIESAINQINVSVPYEIVIVNNNPDADMSELVTYYESTSIDVRFYNNTRNIGMLGNVNRCVELARGDWIAFLHDDDLLLPQYVAEISRFLNSNVACLIPKRYLLFDGKERKLIERRRIIKRFILNLFPKRVFTIKRTYSIHVADNVYTWQNCYCAPSCGTIYNKKAIIESGLFSPEGTYAWDFFSFLKLNEKYEIKILNSILSVYRMYTGASLRPAVQLDFFKAFEYQKKFYFKSNDRCGKFIRKFYNEISYLNSNVLCQEAKLLAKDEGYSLIENITNPFKYILFMFYRFRYIAIHHLDVEVPLLGKEKQMLRKNGIK